ncbi:MAG: hypothetical protein ACRCXC_13795 [Legionella sp.]
MQELNQVLNQLEMQELLKLRMKHTEYMNVTAAEMERMIITPGVVVESEDINAFAAKYTEKFSSESWYKKPELDPEGSRAKFHFSADDHSVLVNFALEHSKDAAFILVDEATQTVLAYSDGDGRLLYPDGEREVQQNDILKPSEVSLDTFLELRKATLDSSMK